MKSTDFSAAVARTPHYVAVFELVKLPPWMKSGTFAHTAISRIQRGYIPQLGCEFYPATGEEGGTMVCMEDHRFYRIGVSFLKFKEYRDINKKSSAPALQ